MARDMLAPGPTTPLGTVLRALRPSQRFSRQRTNRCQMKTVGANSHIEPTMTHGIFGKLAQISAVSRLSEILLSGLPKAEAGPLDLKQFSIE